VASVRRTPGVEEGWREQAWAGRGWAEQAWAGNSGGAAGENAPPAAAASPRAGRALGAGGPSADGGGHQAGATAVAPAALKPAAGQLGAAMPYRAPLLSRRANVKPLHKVRPPAVQ
jgi:hypothetical protein